MIVDIAFRLLEVMVFDGRTGSLLSDGTPLHFEIGAAADYAHLIVAQIDVIAALDIFVERQKPAVLQIRFIFLNAEEKIRYHAVDRISDDREIFSGTIERAMQTHG